jgi:hypothetical protein
MCEPADKKAQLLQQSAAVENDGTAARSALKSARKHLTDQLRGRARRFTGETDADRQAALIQEVAQIHGAIEAIDKTIAGRWSASSTAILISAASVLIAVVAAGLNGAVFKLNQDYLQTSKRVDTAISWCTNFYLPNFVSFQSVARELKDPNSPYRLPNKATIAQMDAPTLEDTNVVLDKVKSAEKAKSISSTTKADDVDLYESLLGLLNYIDTGALMANNGDMDREHFKNCFEPFAIDYMERFDHSYIGLKLALTSDRNKDGSLQTAEDGFPFTTCVFKGKCDPNKMKGH